MDDGMTIDEETILAVGAAAPGVSDHRMSGYCAGCGTWDAHGLTCTSCGYAFAPEADEIDRD